MNSVLLRRPVMLAAVATCVALALGAAIAQQPAAEQNVAEQNAATPAAVDFERDIRPLLVERCYACHGPKKQESELRLDLRESAFKGGLNGVVLVAGKPDESDIIKRVTSSDADERMPPKGDRLAAGQVDLLRQWIAAGAKWPEDVAVKARPDWRKHWAYKAPQPPPLPDVANSSWPRGEIDRFVLARLEKEGLQPTPEAARAALVRRLSLDLIGLPPTIAEIDAFVKDMRPDAYEQLVERLLSSPHYGERWGRHWLDAARYADSDGYEKDMSRQIWFYRDWVVAALNRDLPYDQFIIEQLAGDLLPGATQDQIVATGFLRNSMLNEEGAIDPEQFRMEAMFDRMDAIGKSVLGLTIQCAQCHTHKFDPLVHEEYYRMFAYLNNDHESSPVVYLPDEQRKIAEIEPRIAQLENDLRHSTPDWQTRLSAWEDAMRPQPKWEAVALSFSGENSQRYYFLEDQSVLAQGYAPTKFSATFNGKSEMPEIRAFRLELLTDPNLPAGGPGRSFKGTAALTDIIVKATNLLDPSQNRTVKFTRATADFSNAEAPLEANFDDRSKNNRVTGDVSLAIDGKDETAWGIDAGPGRRNQPRKAVFVTDENIGYPNGTLLEIQLVQKHGGWNSDEHMNNNLGRFRISVCGDGQAVADPLPAAARRALDIPADKRSLAEAAAVFSAWRKSVPEFKGLNDEIESLWQVWPAGARTLTLTPRAQPRETAMLTRGDYLKPIRAVTPGVPAFLHPLADPQAPPSRLVFARWLTDRRSPTTARVLVNRVWQAYFGTGIVATSEDFGMQSDPPSHPELLDYLACDFMDHGWSIKHLHRKIVGSATYRQASSVTPKSLERDPQNRLLARGARIRVEGEVVRDIALASSGLLDEHIGGQSIYSPAPSFLFQPPTSYGPFTWIEATGGQRYRRALYTFRRRSTPYPMLQNFDAPNGDFSCVRRTRSNTPLQALTTLNENVFVECAQALGLRLLKEGGSTDAERAAYGFRLCVAREPEPGERDVLVELLKTQRARLDKGELSAVEVATGKADTPLPLPGNVDAKEWGAYTLLARVLLNLDETITKE